MKLESRGPVHVGRAMPLHPSLSFQEGVSHCPPGEHAAESESRGFTEPCEAIGRLCALAPSGGQRPSSVVRKELCGNPDPQTTGTGTEKGTPG